MTPFAGKDIFFGFEDIHLSETGVESPSILRDYKSSPGM